MAESSEYKKAIDIICKHHEYNLRNMKDIATDIVNCMEPVDDIYEKYYPVTSTELVCDNFAYHEYPVWSLYIKKNKDELGVTYIFTEEPEGISRFIPNYPRTLTEWIKKYMIWSGDNIEELKKILLTKKIDWYHNHWMMSWVNNLGK